MQNCLIAYLSIDIKYNLRNINNFIFLQIDICFLHKTKKSLR